MESIQEKIIRVSKERQSAHSSEIKLAQIVSNRAFRQSSNSKKFDAGENAAAGGTSINVTAQKIRTPKKTPKYKIRILGEHDDSVPKDDLPWCYPLLTGGANPMWNTGMTFEAEGTWVYVYLDPISKEYFIDRVSPNTVCEVDPKKSGFQPGDSFLLVPDTMYRKGVGIPDCAEVYNNQVVSEADEKQFNIGKEPDLVFSTWCRATKNEDVGEGINSSLEKGKKISEQLDESFRFLENFKTSIDDSIENIKGDSADTDTTFWEALRTNEVTLQSFNNTISQYRTNMGLMVKDISKWLVKLFTKMKQKMVRQSNVVANALKGLFPNSARFITNEYWDLIAKALACIWNAAIRLLPGFVDRALTSFFQKIVNTANCLVENFISGFLGQILGQIAALVEGVFNNVISALSKVSGLAGSVLNLVDSIGNVLDDIMGILKCEFECFADEKNVIRYSILDGAKPTRGVLDFAKVWDDAKKVAEKAKAVTNIPNDVNEYNWRFDVPGFGETVLDTANCDTGPVFCGVPSVTFWGVKETLGGVGNAVVNGQGELIGVDIVDSGEYNDPPLVDIDDKCGNGHGGTGKVFIGPITGIGEVGVGTTGGIDGSDLGDLDDITYPGDGGQGTTAGTGITYQVTVHDLTPAGIVGASNNKFFIDDKQQRTLTFERGKTYILNQEHVSNDGHPLRFSVTKGGTWEGGVEYTRGVTIDGIPGLGPSPTDTAYSRIVVNNNTPNRLYYYCENHPKMGGVINVITSPTTDPTGPTDTTDIITTTDIDPYTGEIITTRGTDTVDPTEVTIDGDPTSRRIQQPGRNATFIVESVTTDYTPTLTSPGGLTGGGTRGGGTGGGTPGGLTGGGTPGGGTGAGIIGGGTGTGAGTPGGGVVSVKNLNGGTGYNECMTNVPTRGGNGTSLSVDIVKTTGGSIERISINNKGSNYKVGDTITIVGRVGTTKTPPSGYSTPTVSGIGTLGEGTVTGVGTVSRGIVDDITITTTGGIGTTRVSGGIIPLPRLGVTKVLITNSGYGYLSAPNGSMGGMRRTWANRCQTIVRRKNLDWDAPYSPGDVFTLYSGDWVQLPGKPRVDIDQNFDASKLPGAQITGVGSYIPKDMTNFPLSDKTTTLTVPETRELSGISSIATFLTSQFQWGLEDSTFRKTGVVRIDRLDPEVNSKIADWEFYWNDEYLGIFHQEYVGQVPQYMDDDSTIPTSIASNVPIELIVDNIVYRVGIPQTYDPEEALVASPGYTPPIPWVRSALTLPKDGWVLTDPYGWSSFLKTYGVYPSVDDPNYTVVTPAGQGHSAIWRVVLNTEGAYSVDIQADGRGTIELRKYNSGESWRILGSTTLYDSHNRFHTFRFSTGGIPTGVYELRATIENVKHQDDLHGDKTYEWEINPGAIAWMLKDRYGMVVKTSLDDFGIVEEETGADVLYNYKTYFKIDAYAITVDKVSLTGQWFDCEVDYRRARSLGFTDCDIRHFLENNPEIQLDNCMLSKMNDDNWGKCDGDLMVSLTAPGCPPPPCLPENTYPVVVSLDEIYIENSGFGFNCCKDTVNIEPANGAKAEIGECINGEIRSIKVLDSGSGFTSLPEISINTETGYNAILKPIMKFDRTGESEISSDTPVIQVIDCVGKVV